MTGMGVAVAAGNSRTDVAVNAGTGVSRLTTPPGSVGSSTPGSGVIVSKTPRFWVGEAKGLVGAIVFTGACELERLQALKTIANITSTINPAKREMRNVFIFLS
jgi:hypothetical protein